MVEIPESLVAKCCATWRLELGAVLPADYSYVAAVTRADGSPAILKIVVREPENEHEAEGLRRWDGNGTVRLLADDPARGALLLERLEPGTLLWELPEDEGVAIAARLLRRLWLAVEDDHPFERVDLLAAGWAEELLARFDSAGRPFDEALAREAAAGFGELGATPREQVLVHRDFHRGNILAAQREPWLAIDPKTSVGEREFDSAWLLGDRVSDPRRRLDFLAAELDLDRERLRAWGVARYTLGGLWDYECGGDGAWGVAVATAIRAA